MFHPIMKILRITQIKKINVIFIKITKKIKLILNQTYLFFLALEIRIFLLDNSLPFKFKAFSKSDDLEIITNAIPDEAPSLQMTFTLSVRILLLLKNDIKSFQSKLLSKFPMNNSLSSSF